MCGKIFFQNYCKCTKIRSGLSEHTFLWFCFHSIKEDALCFQTTFSNPAGCGASSWKSCSSWPLGSQTTQRLRWNLTDLCRGHYRTLGMQSLWAGFDKPRDPIQLYIDLIQPLDKHSWDSTEVTAIMVLKMPRMHGSPQCPELCFDWTGSLEIQWGLDAHLPKTGKGRMIIAPFVNLFSSPYVFLYLNGFPHPLAPGSFGSSKRWNWISRWCKKQ